MLGKRFEKKHFFDIKKFKLLTVKTSMKRVLPLFYSAYIGICIYSVLNIFFGVSGIIAFKKLDEFKHGVEKNLTILENRYLDFGKELNLLTSSSEVIRLKARELGYFEDNEIVIKVVGLEDKRNFHSVGRMIKYSDGDIDRKSLFRTISLISALTFLLIIIIFKRKSGG